MRDMEYGEISMEYLFWSDNRRLYMARRDSSSSTSFISFDNLDSSGYKRLLQDVAGEIFNRRLIYGSIDAWS